MLQSEEKKQELMGKTVEELRKICKEKGVSYYENGKRLAKVPMIDRLVEALNDVEQPEQPVETEVEITVEDTERLERKKKYVEQAKVGTIVAFRLPNGKVISAAITRKSTKGRKFMVETKYGAEYKISFDDVLWVRTNKRWPKGIYLLFKQNIRKKLEVTKDGEEVS